MTIDTEARGSTTVLIAEASATTTSDAPNAIATMRSVMSTRPILPDGPRYVTPGSHGLAVHSRSRTTSKEPARMSKRAPRLRPRSRLDGDRRPRPRHPPGRPPRPRTSTSPSSPGTSPRRRSRSTRSIRPTSSSSRTASTAPGWTLATQRGRRRDVDRVVLRAQRPVRQGVLRPHAVVGRVRQPLHGVARPSRTRARSRWRSAPTEG